MKKILFVCHGNICRSPMAEFVRKDLIQTSWTRGRIRAASAATSTEKIGNSVYPPARRSGRPVVHRRLQGCLMEQTEGF